MPARDAVFVAGGFEKHQYACMETLQWPYAPDRSVKGMGKKKTRALTSARYPQNNCLTQADNAQEASKNANTFMETPAAAYAPAGCPGVKRKPRKNVPPTHLHKTQT